MSLTSLVRKISALMILLTGTSAFAALSPEFAVSEVVLQPAGLTQRDPVAASDGQDFLGVWVDDRPGPVEGNIRYTVVRSDGTIENPLGAIIPFSTNSYPVAAFWTGIDYLVFVDGEVGGSVSRIDRNGIEASAPIRILADDEQIISVASNGSTFLILFTSSSGTSVTLEAVSINRSLQTLGTQVLPAQQPAVEILGSVTANDTEYGVVWGSRAPDSTTWSLATVHLDSDAALLDAAAKSLGTMTGLVLPRIASNNDSYMVSLGQISGSSRSTAIVGLDDDATAVTPRIDFSGGLSTGLISADGSYIVPIFESNGVSESDILLFRVGPLAQNLPSRTLTTAPGSQNYPASAAGSDRIFWAWNDGRRTGDQPTDVFFALTDVTGFPLEGTNPGRGVSITYSAPEQSAPDVAFDGTNYFVVWIEVPEDNVFQLFGGRVSSTGEPLDGGGVRLFETNVAQYGPRVTFDGANYVVIWREGSPFQSKLYAARISPSGSLLDTSPLEVGDISGASSYAIASNGSGTAVVFGGSPFAAENQIRMSTITREGQVLDRGGRVIQTVPVNPVIDLASDGRDYLVVWSTQQTGISAIRVLGTGVVGTPRAVSASGTDASVAFGGGQYLVTWSAPVAGALQIRGRIVDLQGNPTSAPEHLLGLRSIDSLGGVRTRDLAYDGIRFALAWTDPDFASHPADPTSDVRARQIARDGTPQGTVEGIPISTTFGEDAEPAVAPGVNRVIIVYSRIAPEATGVRRLYARFLSTEVVPRQRPAKRQ